jgi:hypothetical protein
LRLKESHYALSPLIEARLKRTPNGQYDPSYYNQD